MSGLDNPAQRNLQLTPYVLGKSRGEGRWRGSVETGDVGVDLKYSVTPSLTLDATYNTDFAQVEVDDQQINLDRFNLFFPEKRPFFLENAGLFSVGMSGEAEVFFSRAIGIGPDGGTIPIIAGGRLSGRVAGNTSVGILNMQTQEVRGLPANNFSVARVQRELPNRSAVGAIFVNRQATSGLARGDNYNRSYAVDGRFGFGQNGLVNAFAARTQTPGLGGDEHAYQVGVTHNTEAWRLGAGYAEVGENFNPEVGFLSRDSGFRKLELSVNRNIRLAEGSFWKFHELRPHAGYNAYWNFDGLLETGRMHIDQHWQLRAGHEFHTGMNLTHEGVTIPFEIYPGIFVPAGTYDPHRSAAGRLHKSGRAVSVREGLRSAGFFGGSRVNARLSYGSVWAIPSIPRSWSRNDIDICRGARL